MLSLPRNIQLVICIVLFTLLACASKKGRNFCEDDSQMDYEISVTVLLNQIDKNPNDQKLHYHLAMAYYKIGQYQKAEIVFSDLLELNDNYESVYVNRGICRMLLNNKTGSCDDLKMAIKKGENPAVFDGKTVSTYIQENCVD